MRTGRRALLLALLAPAAVRAQGVAGPAGGEVALPPGVVIGGPFALRDHTGREVTERAWPGRWLLIYFGYSFCPDVCPTELAQIAGAMDELTPAQAAQVQPLFVTIDPERDTPAQLAGYVQLFHPALVGLTGSPAQAAAAGRAFRVHATRVQPEGASTYLMDHSSFAYLIGPDGRLAALFRPGTSSTQFAAAIRRHAGWPQPNNPEEPKP